jgi:hypothetical protein
MKKSLPVYCFLVLLTSLFTTNAFSQALPDPGTDPITLVDSVAQTHLVKKEVANLQETAVLTTSNIPTQQLASNDDFSSACNREEKPKQSSR